MKNYSRELLYIYGGGNSGVYSEKPPKFSRPKTQHSGVRNTRNVTISNEFRYNRGTETNQVQLMRDNVEKRRID